MRWDRLFTGFWIGSMTYLIAIFTLLVVVPGAKDPGWNVAIPLIAACGTLGALAVSQK